MLVRSAAGFGAVVAGVAAAVVVGLDCLASFHRIGLGLTGCFELSCLVGAAVVAVFCWCWKPCWSIPGRLLGFRF